MWLDQRPSSTEDKMQFFIFSYLVAATSVNRVYKLEVCVGAKSVGAAGFQKSSGGGVNGAP